MLVNAYCTHRSPPGLSFPHELRNRRDRSDPELAPHLRGFMGFVMGGGRRPMTQTRYHVIRHLERVQNHLALDVEPSAMNAFAAWARAANAIVFLTDSSVRAPDGKVLVAPGTGDAEPGADVPYPEDAVRRKAATEEKLAALEIRVPKSLPPVVSEIEVDLRAASDVVSRCSALYACAVRAESLASDEPMAAAEICEKVPLAQAAMSPKERAFMAADAPAQQEIANFAWRYEALATLRWAVDPTAELPFPEDICDVPALAKAMREVKRETFQSTARLRAASEILDELDLCYRLNWAVTDARVKGTPGPEVEAGAVVERHYAFNWLTRFQDADWDDVDTPT